MERLVKKLSPTRAFTDGWRDGLVWSATSPGAAAAALTRQVYDRAPTGIAMAYERGRYCAALWLAVHRDDSDARTITYTAAYRRMDRALRAAVRAERKYCALKPPPSIDIARLGL